MIWKAGDIERVVGKIVDRSIIRKNNRIIACMSGE